MAVVRITLAPSAFSITIKRSIYFSGTESGANPEAKKGIQSRKDSLFPVKGIGQSKKGTESPVFRINHVRNGLFLRLQAGKTGSENAQITTMVPNRVPNAIFFVSYLLILALSSGLLRFFLA